MTTEIDICPVCDMIGEFKDHALKRSEDKYIYFCSEQCKEMFSAHPMLYLGKKHRDMEIKRRTLRMDEPLGAEAAELITTHLKAMMGIREVSVDGAKIDITYDLLQVTEKMIEKALADTDLPLNKGWLERLHRAWVQSTEASELNNLSTRPSTGCHGRSPGS